MEEKKIAIVGSMHVCPMVTGVTPHVGGPISGPGNPGVLIDGMPVSVMGDMCVCAGPPDVIVTGCSGVLVDGVPIVTETCLTAHGGMVTTGVEGVTVSSTPMKSAVVPLKRISFPKISLTSTIFANKLASNAEKRIAEVKEEIMKEDDRERSIFNIHWKHEDIRVSESKIKRRVTVNADTWGYAEGECLTFSIYDEKEKSMKELSATVEDNHIEAVWEVIETTLDSEKSNL